MRAAQRFPIRLVDARMLSASVRSLTFEPLDVPVDYRPGESVYLVVPTATGLAMRRPYSVASAPGALPHGRFELAVTRVERGPTSTALHALPIGADLVADQPHGGWLSLDGDHQSALLVATGTGLAPFRALLQEQVLMRVQTGAHASTAPLALLFGCRAPDDILWREEMAGWQRALPSLRVYITLSRPPPEWSGLKGYVQHHLEQLIRARMPERLLLCGLSPMVEEVEQRALALGVAEDAIRMELYDR